MTKRFILDENVLILAQRGENDSGELDPTCLRLVQQIIEVCHTIVVSPGLWNTYFQQLTAPGHARAEAGFRLVRILRRVAQIAGKVDIRPSDPPAFPEEVTIPQGSQDDVEIVRLAVDSGASLVTTDQPLRQDLRDSGVEQRYGLSVMSPSEALDTL